MLDQDNKSLQKVEDLGGCKALRKISLAGNALQDLKGLETNYQLTVIKAVHNQITIMPQAA